MSIFCLIAGDTQRDLSRPALADTTTGLRAELPGGVAQVMERARLPARPESVVRTGVGWSPPPRHHRLVQAQLSQRVLRRRPLDGAALGLRPVRARDQSAHRLFEL